MNSIVFSRRLPQAIIEDRKTQTRRIMKPQPGYAGTQVSHGLAHFPCPYGKPGDRLWVRENHFRFGHWEPVKGQLTKTGKQKWAFVADRDDVLFAEPEMYEIRFARNRADPETPFWHFRLARFMPQKLSRITIELESVRVEVVSDISEDDAIAEGIERSGLSGWLDYGENYNPAFDWLSPVNSFRSLWDATHGEGSFDRGDWVWALTFKHIKQG